MESKNTTDKPSATVLAWAFVMAAVVIFLWIALAAWGIEASWNALTEVTKLPEITWANGVQVYVLGYFASCALGIRRGKANG